VGGAVKEVMEEQERKAAASLREYLDNAREAGAFSAGFGGK
jgi:hypothetical protein